MGKAPDVSEKLARAARDVQRAAWIACPAEPLDVAQLRDVGWQLIQLTAGLADVSAALAGHHSAHRDRLWEVDGGNPGPDLRRAGRALTALRQAASAAHAAARDYHAAVNHLARTPNHQILNERR